MRPDWDDYFLGIAEAVSRRGDCSRRQVGCVIVGRDKRIVATGYNGTVSGQSGCLDGACPRATSGAKPGEGYEQTACIALHAEMNAVAHASRSETDGGIAYITAEPCYMCQKVLAAGGVFLAIWPTGSMRVDLRPTG